MTHKMLWRCYGILSAQATHFLFETRLRGLLHFTALGKLKMLRRRLQYDIPQTHHPHSSPALEHWKLLESEARKNAHSFLPITSPNIYMFVCNLAQPTLAQSMLLIWVLNAKGVTSPPPNNSRIITKRKKGPKRDSACFLSKYYWFQPH